MQKLEDIAATREELRATDGLPTQVAIGFIQTARKANPIRFIDTVSDFNDLRFT